MIHHVWCYETETFCRLTEAERHAVDVLAGVNFSAGGISTTVGGDVDMIVVAVAGSRRATRRVVGAAPDDVLQPETVGVLKREPDDLIAERLVIEHYQELIRYFGDSDPTTRRMLEKILEEEEDHAADMHDLLVAHQGEGFLQ